MENYVGPRNVTRLGMKRIAAASVPTPPTNFDELFIDTNGCLKSKGADAVVKDYCAGGAAVTLPDLFSADKYFETEDFQNNGDANASNGYGNSWRYTGNQAAVRLTEANHPGILQIGQNSSGATHGFLVKTHNISILSGDDIRGPLLADQHAFKAWFWFKTLNLLNGGVNDANSEYRIGFGSGANNPPGFDQTGEIRDGVFLRKSFTGANWHAVAVAGGSLTASADIVAGTDDWIGAGGLIIEKDGSNITFTVPGQSPVSISTNIPTVPLAPFFGVTSKGSELKQMKVDRYDLLITGITR